MHPYRYEKPVEVDDTFVEETRHEADEGDLFEMRFCEGPGCENALPLDKPGTFVTIYGQRVLVCAACARAHDRYPD